MNLQEGKGPYIPEPISMGLYILERRHNMNKYESRAGSIALGAIILCLPLVGGMISSFIAGDQMMTFGDMNKPMLAPPAWLFPIAWTVLYVLMGIALLLLIRSKSKYKTGAICLFISQLLMNFIWSPVFFNMHEYWLAFIVIITMWITTILTAITSWFVDKRATYLLIPLILWTTFAAYLNAGIAVLN